MTTETSNARGEWVLVPHSPTPEMIEAGILFGTSPNKATIIYQSMVNAAPPPAAARGDVRGLVAELRKLCSWKHLMSYNEAYFGEPEGELKSVVYAIERNLPPLAAEGVQAGEVDDDAIARVFMGLHIPDKIAADQPITPEDWFAFGRACAALSQPEARFQGVGATQAAHELNTRLTEDRAILNDIRDAMGGGPYDTLAARIRKHQPEARGVVDEAFLLELREKFQEINLDDNGEDHLDVSAEGLHLIDAKLTALTEARND